MTKLSLVSAVLLASAVGTARADDALPTDGYCEFVNGVAQSNADFFYAPNVIGSLGYVKEPNETNNNAVVSGGRAVLGLSYNFIGILQGNATKERGAADCKRHQALDRVQGETVYRALRAKIKIYEEAMGQADKILTKTIEDVKGHRNTAQELVATRLRVNELHDLNSDARRQLDALPKPTKGEELGGALAAYYRFDNDIELQEGKLRKLQGLQVKVSGGFDTFFDRTDNNPYFILLEVGVNLGVFWQGTQNDRALAGRKRMVREQHQVQLVDTTVTHLKDEMEAEGQREQETAALESDLAKQIAVIEQIGGDDNMRVRDSVWFDYIKVKAEHAYFEAHVASLKEVIGEAGNE